MPAVTEYSAPTSALATQLAAEEEYRRKERERYAAQMGVDPSAVGKHDVLLNQIHGPAPRVVTNLLGGNNIAPPPMATAHQPGMFKKYGPLLGMLPMLLR